MKKDLFDLTGKIALITGGGGFLSSQSFAPAVIEYGGKVILGDIDTDKLKRIYKELTDKYGKNKVYYTNLDVTSEESISSVVEKYSEINCVIITSCNNPKQSKDSKSITNKSRFENFDLNTWKKDFDVGLTGTFLVCKILGNHFISKGGGKFITIGSDMALINQDQSLYEIPGVEPENQPVKPCSYSIHKSGVVSLTKYMASYPAFNENNVRINCISPGAIYNPDMTDEFVQKIKKKFPIKRLGTTEELKGIVVYLLSENSNFCQGSIISIDGGRTLL